MKYDKQIIEQMMNLQSGELQAGWTSTLEKGDNFNFKDVLWTVTVKTPKQLRIKSESGETLSFKRYGKNYGAEGKQANFFRDCQGQIMVDLVNSNNSFHEFSDIFKLTYKALKEQR